MFNYLKIGRSSVALVAAGLMLAACGSSSASTSGTTPTTPIPMPNINGGKPTITVPTAAAPTTLKSTDLVVGTGPAAKSGDNVTVQYVGANYADAKQFDASWDHGQPFSFQLGAGSVIPGWDKGVVGMKGGGRRELVIPSALGYGPQGSPPVIAPNETLVFVIDLVSLG